MKVICRNAYELVNHPRYGKHGLRELRGTEVEADLEFLLDLAPTRRHPAHSPRTIVYSKDEQLFHLVRANADLAISPVLLRETLGAMGCRVPDIAFLPDWEREKIVEALRGKLPDMKARPKVEFAAEPSERPRQPLFSDEEIRRLCKTLENESGARCLLFPAPPKDDLMIYAMGLSEEVAGKRVCRPSAFIFLHRDQEKPAWGDVSILFYPRSPRAASMVKTRGARAAAAALERALPGPAGARYELWEEKAINVRLTPAPLARPVCRLPPVELFESGAKIDDDLFEKLSSGKPEEICPEPLLLVLAAPEATAALGKEARVPSGLEAAILWQRVQGPLYDPDFSPAASRILSRTEAWTTGDGRSDRNAGYGDDDAYTSVARLLCRFPDIYGA